MSLKINTNLMSVAAQRYLSKHQSKLAHAQASLASGNRIVNPSDDPTGLSIVENLRAQVAGIQMARSNASAAQSFIQVGEGGLNEMTNLLVRIRELSMQAASDTTSKNEKKIINKEAKQLIQEIDRIAKSTQFSEQKILDGSLKKELEYHVGPFASQENKIHVRLDADARAKGLGLGGLSIGTKKQAFKALEVIDKSIRRVSEMRANFGSIQRRLESTMTNLDVQYENLSSAKSNIKDADIALETAKAASSQILQQAAISTLAQANNNGKTALRLLS